LLPQKTKMIDVPWLYRDSESGTYEVRTPCTVQGVVDAVDTARSNRFTPESVQAKKWGQQDPTAFLHAFICGDELAQSAHDKDVWAALKAFGNTENPVPETCRLASEAVSRALMLRAGISCSGKAPMDIVGLSR
jgi:hypothetical protein